MSEISIKYLTRGETKQLFATVQRDCSRHALRNRAIFALAKYCALRISEPGMILESDLDISRYQIYCRREKNSNNNMIRICDPEVIKALQDYLQVKKLLYPESIYLFPSQKGNPISRQMLDNLMRSYCAPTSIPGEKHHFHVLKHTRAVELAEMGFDLKDVQWWLGHKSAKNTLIYMTFTTCQQEHLYQKLMLGMQHLSIEIRAQEKKG